MTRLLIVDGHPDPDPARFVHALTAACERGAREGGHAVERLDVAELSLPPLRSAAEWAAEPPPEVAAAQAAVARAERLVVAFPLWQGDMPAALKVFFEQVFRPGFAMPREGAARATARMLKGRSARLVITMGMPAPAYRWWFGAHSARSLERSLLGLVGIRAARRILVGSVESLSDERRRAWIERLREIGAKGG